MLIKCIPVTFLDDILNQIQPGPWGENQRLLGMAAHLGHIDDLDTLVFFGANIEGRDTFGECDRPKAFNLPSRKHHFKLRRNISHKLNMTR